MTFESSFLRIEEVRELSLDASDTEILKIDADVKIDDGSGSITVSDVREDLIIEDDGSGGLSYQNVQGTVEQDT